MDGSDLLLGPTSSARASEPQLGDCQICPDGQSQGLSCGRRHCTASQVWQSLTCLRCHPGLPRTANVEWHQPTSVPSRASLVRIAGWMDGLSCRLGGPSQHSARRQTLLCQITVHVHGSPSWSTTQHNAARSVSQAGMDGDRAAGALARWWRVTNLAEAALRTSRRESRGKPGQREPGADQLDMSRQELLPPDSKQGGVLIDVDRGNLGIIGWCGLWMRRTTNVRAKPKLMEGLVTCD